MSALSIFLYILLPIIVIFGTMYLFRRKRDQEAGRPPSNKMSDIKEDDIRDKEGTV